LPKIKIHPPLRPDFIVSLYEMVMVKSPRRVRAAERLPLFLLVQAGTTCTTLNLQLLTSACQSLLNQKKTKVAVSPGNRIETRMCKWASRLSLAVVLTAAGTAWPH
jgi:hypothetical protein